MGTHQTGPKGMGERLGAWPHGRLVTGQADPWSLWLRRSLLETYGDVAAEPIPSSLLRIIEGAGGGEDRNG
jgi:hypothetical protein